MIPPIITATKNISKPYKRDSFSGVRPLIELATITAKPAAGPETPRAELLIVPTIIPPMIPAIIPDNGGASDATAIPKHRGTATKKTIIEAGKSFLKCLNMELLMCFLINVNLKKYKFLEKVKCN